MNDIIDKNTIRRLARALYRAKKELGVQSTAEENWRAAEEYLKKQLKHKNIRDNL